MDIPNDVKYILDRINAAGCEAYIVGGCVRDFLLGMTPKDWDITTSAAPLKIKELFGHTIDTGIKHGTVTVVMNHKNYEVTTYRIDGEYLDSRHPSDVVFTDNIAEDLSRRDFTMNAIAYHYKTGFIDAFDGRKDISAGMIRGVGNPDVRFNEDALRMLRAARFSAQLGFEIEPQTLEAIYKNAALIENISVERIREEFIKLLCSQNPDKIKILIDTKLCNYFLPVLSDVVTDERMRCISELPERTDIRLAALLAGISEQEVKNIMRGLKFDIKTLKSVTCIAANIEMPLEESPADIRRSLAAIGAEELEKLIIIRQSLTCDARQRERLERVMQQMKTALEQKQCYTLASLSINGDDIKSLGEKNGREIGRLLGLCLDAVIENPLMNNKEALISMIGREVLK